MRGIITFLISLCLLFFAAFTYYFQVFIPNHPVIKIVALGTSPQTGNIILQLANIGKRPISGTNIQLFFIPFEANTPLESKEIVVNSPLRIIPSGETETFNFNLSFSDERFKDYKFFFVIMVIRDSELLEKVATDILYRFDFTNRWVPLLGNSGVVDDEQEKAIYKIIEEKNKGYKNIKNIEFVKIWAIITPIIIFLAALTTLLLNLKKISRWLGNIFKRFAQGDKKRITELEKQNQEYVKRIAELEAKNIELEEKTHIIGEVPDDCWFIHGKVLYDKENGTYYCWNCWNKIGGRERRVLDGDEYYVKCNVCGVGTQLKEMKLPDIPSYD